MSSTDTFYTFIEKMFVLSLQESTDIHKSVTYKRICFVSEQILSKSEDWCGGFWFDSH